jgi:hypothetical protein
MKILDLDPTDLRLGNAAAERDFALTRGRISPLARLREHPRPALEPSTDRRPRSRREIKPQRHRVTIQAQEELPQSRAGGSRCQHWRSRGRERG